MSLPLQNFLHCHNSQWSAGAETTGRLNEINLYYHEQVSNVYYTHPRLMYRDYQHLYYASKLQFMDGKRSPLT